MFVPFVSYSLWTTCSGHKLAQAALTCEPCEEGWRFTPPVPSVYCFVVYVRLLLSYLVGPMFGPSQGLSNSWTHGPIYEVQT